MTKLELRNNPIWHNLSEILENIDGNFLVKKHLELCNYKVSGYWDEKDEFYEEITLPRSLSAELISSSIGVTGEERWIKLKFVLTSGNSTAEGNPKKLGELILIFNENLHFIDENWQIEVDSSLVMTN